MIKNERQYQITRGQIARFEKTLAQLERPMNEAARPSRLLQQAEHDALASQLESLYGEVREYEALRDGRVTVFITESIEGLPQSLIKARIARGLTQKELAERLGLKEQQVQRYEATNYASASLSRLQEVIAALQVNVTEQVSLIK